MRIARTLERVLTAALALAPLASPVPARAAAADTAAAAAALATPRSLVVPANGTTLHVVDYGGEGPALVFLAGLGNSAHVFDGFAPRFRGTAHVWAVTRRGYGESGRPASGYDTGSLVEDLRAVLDSLHVGRAVLAGHSVAGDELTEFAARYPERVAGLVYLDAAYDRSHTTRRLLGMAVLGQVPPAPPGPNGKDRASVRAACDYLERVYGVRWPESEVAATRVFDARGRWTKEGTPASTNVKILRGELAPRYAAVRAPVLAIYSVDRTVDRDLPWLRHVFFGRGAMQLRAMRYRSAQGHWESRERRRLAEALPSARIVPLRDASHYVFLSDGDRVEREMRAFLDAVR